jgi:acyl-coenzyme A thioesterase PaaI-like protein
MTSTFAHATAVHRVDGHDASDARFDAEVMPGWDIGGNANGGYLLAIAGRAMRDAIGLRPLSLTAHYLRPAPAGVCEIVVSTVRSGRRLATATAQLTMNDAVVLQLVGTFGEQQPGGLQWHREPPIELPDYDECVRRDVSPDGVAAAFHSRLATRVRPGDDGYNRGEPTGDPEVRGWFALAAGESIDVIGVLLAADSFPPPIFNLGPDPGWVPTIELTVHIRGVPAPGPLRCAFRSRFVDDGLVDEEGEIWDGSGALVAQTRQLSLIPRA